MLWVFAPYDLQAIPCIGSKNDEDNTTSCRLLKRNKSKTDAGAPQTGKKVN
jgi:hypothetical protein